jgi:phosphatidyl-myo-inositol dimannoside synthase
MEDSSETRKYPRALVLTPDYPPAHGGIQRLVHSVVRHWSRLEARVVTCSVNGATAFDRSESIDVRRTNVVLGHRLKMAWLNAAGFVEAQRFHPDVVLSAHIVTAPAAWGLKRARQVPFAQYLHANEVVARPRLTRFAVRNAAATVVVSRHTEALLRDAGVTASTLHRIAPGADVIVSGAMRKSERPTIVTVSRLDQRYKGHDIMIRALSSVRERFPEVLWIVIGDGELRAEYEQMARAQGLEGHVRFLGALSDGERNTWLGSAHIFAMPSRAPSDAGGEGFGIVFLEAAAYGLPVVAGNVAGARDAVVDGETGLLVNPTDEAAVADAICELLLDPARAEGLGREGAARARDFAWPLVSRRVEDLLLDLAAG